MDSPHKQINNNNIASFFWGGLLISAGPQHNFNRGRCFNHRSTLLTFTYAGFDCGSADDARVTSPCKSTQACSREVSVNKLEATQCSNLRNVRPWWFGVCLVCPD